jgi:hypothetical protein
MKNITIFLIVAFFTSGCHDAEKVKKIELPQEGVSMQIPEKWNFNESDLFDQNKKIVGTIGIGTITTIPQIDCKEYMNRVINEGANIETDKGSIGFVRPDGGDIFFENFKLDILEIHKRKIYRLHSNYSSYGESGEEKGINCQYCIELENHKLFLFDFYFDEKQAIQFGKADTIISTVELTE